MAIVLEVSSIVGGQEKAAIIGEEPAWMVVMHTGVGGTRMIDMLVGDPLEISSRVVDRFLRSRGDLLLTASFYQLSVFEFGSGSNQRHKVRSG